MYLLILKMQIFLFFFDHMDHYKVSLLYNVGWVGVKMSACKVNLPPPPLCYIKRGSYCAGPFITLFSLAKTGVASGAKSV